MSLFLGLACRCRSVLCNAGDSPDALDSPLVLPAWWLQGCDAGHDTGLPLSRRVPVCRSMRPLETQRFLTVRGMRFGKGL